MIKCRSCGSDHAPNRLYCNECGAWIGEGLAPKGTRRLAPPGGTGALVTPRPPPLSLALRTPDGQKRFEHVLDGELLIGRVTAELAGRRADVDLEPLGGADRGVSRRHARLVRVGDEVLLEDLGSLNGTRVAGAALAPGRPHAVKPGDELQFGSVVLRIEWKSG